VIRASFLYEIYREEFNREARSRGALPRKAWGSLSTEEQTIWARTARAMSDAGYKHDQQHSNDQVAEMRRTHRCPTCGAEET